MKETFADRKRHRTEHFYRFTYGFKRVKCTACGGSGRYDNHGSPRCSGCGGTGYDRDRIPEMEQLAMALLRGDKLVSDPRKKARFVSLRARESAIDVALKHLRDAKRHAQAAQDESAVILIDRAYESLVETLRGVRAKVKILELETEAHP